MTLLAMIGTWQLVMIIVILLIPLLVLIDVLRNEFTGSNKIIWLVIVLMLPLLGALLYLLIGTKQKVKK